MTEDVRRARKAFLWVGVIVPFALLAMATLIALSWAPELPDPVAIHLSGDGPDGFAPLWADLLLLVGVSAGLIALFAVIVFFADRLPYSSISGTSGPQQWSTTARLLGATSLGTTGMIAFVVVLSLGLQRGLDDATKAPEIGGWVALAFLLLGVLAVIGWFLQPKVTVVPPEAMEAAPLPLADSERAVWVGTAAWGRSGRIALCIGVALGIASVVLTIAQGNGLSWSVLIATLSALLVILVTVSMLSFRVRITAAGLRVRSTIGWPRKTIPANEITNVRVVEVSPFREFGGWGWRTGLDGRAGVVLRTGRGIEVAYAADRAFVVTINDAETAAAVLASAARTAAEGDRGERA